EAARQDVVAGAAVNNVVAAVAGNPVDVAAAINTIIAATAGELVIPLIAVDRIVAAIAANDVVIRAAGDEMAFIRIIDAERENGRKIMTAEILRRQRARIDVLQAQD